MSDIYLSITETPTVVTLTNPLIPSVSVTVGTSVTVSNFPAVTTVAGTVAVGEISGDQQQFFGDGHGNLFSLFQAGALAVESLPPISGSVTASVQPGFIEDEINSALFGSDQLVNNLGNYLVFSNNVPVSGTVTANTGLSQPLTDAQLRSSAVAVSLSSVPTHGVTIASLPAATVTVANFPATQVVSVSNLPAAQVVTGTVSLDPSSLVALENITVTVGSSISVSNFPGVQSISGTVTANVSGTVPVSISSVTIGSLPAISGAVTANVQLLAANTGYDGQNGSAAFGISGADVNAIRTVIYSSANNTFNGDAGAPVDSSNPLPVTGNISGTVTANAGSGFASAIYDGLLNWQDNEGGFVISSMPVISGTVTANNPSGALTTRFGSVATANLAFITSAVTNTSRKYLLAQNISAGTVTIGIGFSPTTTQGIQLTAGAGLTFDSFCPTGAVYWLGAVTGAAFTILEG